MRVVADLGLCQGHQMCLAEASDIFEFDDVTDQVVIALDPVPEARRAEVMTAVKYCPAFALSVDDGDSTQPVEED
jgi:ferredoxin